MSAPELDPRAQAERFLAAVLEPPEPRGFSVYLAGGSGVRVRPSDTELDDWREHRMGLPGGREAFVDYALEAAPTREVYLCPAVRLERQRRQGGAAPPVVVWTDVDRDEPADPVLLAKLVAAGALVVASGTGTRCHVHVPLSRPVPVAEHRALNRALCQALGGDLGKIGDDSLLRVPGTLNHKHDPPHPVVLTEPGTGERIDPAELATLLGIAEPLAEAARRTEHNADAADAAEVVRFAEAHATGDRRAELATVVGRLDAAPGRRHESLTVAAPWAAREARLGYYPAETARAELERAFLASKPDGAAEFARVWSWAVGQAMTAPETALEDRRERLAERDRARAVAGYLRTAGRVRYPDGAGGWVATVLDGVAGSTARRADPRFDAPEAEPADDGAETGSAEAGDGLDDDVRAELRRREVRRRADAAERPPRRGLAELLVGAEDLERIAAPAFALRGLIRDRGVGFLGGMRGTHKTFLLTSWACHLALGTPWLGRDEFAVDRPRRVLYIATEGGGDVRERVRAWEAEHGRAVPSAHLTVLDGPVRLNDSADLAELAAIIGTGGWDVIIVDTFHRATPGVNENDSAEVGAVFAAVAEWRDRFGVTVLLADHTGHRGDGLRGSSSKGDDADFVLLTVRRAGQVSLVVDKLKSVRDGQEYPIRLRPVPAVRNANDDPSAVVEIGKRDPATFPDDDAPWWERRLTDDADALITGRGRGVARDIVRFLLHHAESRDGFTEAAIRDALRKAPRYASSEDDRYRRVWWEGWTRVRREGAELAVPEGRTADRFVVAEAVREASE